MSNNPSQQVKNCLVDEPTYKKNRKPIVQQIGNGNRIYIVALVDTVKESLKDKKTNPESKLIGLYFLKEAMDTKDPELVNYVKEKILKRLGDIAKGKESEVFPSKTDFILDERLKKNFYQLLLECIYFWGEYHGTDEAGKSTKFKATLQNVAKSVEMPKKAVFFSKDKDKNKKPKPGAEEASNRDPKSEFQSSASQPAVPQKSAEKEPRDREHRQKDPRREVEEEAKTSSARPKAGKKNQDLQKIEETLKSVQGKKEVLFDVLTSEDRPAPEMLEMMAEEFKGASKELQESLDTLFTMDHPDKEAVLNKVLEENEFTTKYLENYDKLRRRKMTIDQFKEATISSISATGGASPTKTPQVQERVPSPGVESRRAEKRPPQQELRASRNASPGQNEPAERPRKSKRNDFEVDFNSAGQPQAENQDNTFGNFQQSGGQVAGKQASSPFENFNSAGQPNAQFDNGFNEFNQNQNREQNSPDDAFNNFGTAPPRTQNSNFNQEHPSDGGFNDFGTAPPRPQNGNFNQEHPSGDAFSNFGTAPPGHHNQENFGEFNQERPQEQRFDGFGEFNAASVHQHEEFAQSQNRQERQTRNSRARPQASEPNEEFNNANDQGFADPFAQRDSRRTGPPRPLGASPRSSFNNQNEGFNQTRRQQAGEEVKQEQGIGFDDFQDFDFEKNPAMENSQVSGFNFEYDKKRQTPNSIGSRDVFGEFDGEEIGGIRGNNKRKSVQQEIKKDPFDDDVFAAAAREAEAEAQAEDQQHNNGFESNPFGNNAFSSNAHPQQDFGWSESNTRAENPPQQDFRWDQPQANGFEAHERREDFSDRRQGHAEFEEGKNAFENSRRDPVRSNFHDDPLTAKREETASFNKGSIRVSPPRDRSYNEAPQQTRFPSPPRAQSDQNFPNAISAEKIISKTFVSSKPGDMESEKLRRERDKIMTELENVKRMFNGLKVEHDFMAKNHEVTGSEYNRTRFELDELRKARSHLGSTNEQLRYENDSFKQMQGSLAQENEGHLKIFGDMNREISALKGKLADHDVLDFRQRNEARLYDLEASLRNAHNKVHVMHDLNQRIEGEHRVGSLQMDRLRQGYLDPLTLGQQMQPIVERVSLMRNGSNISPPRAVTLSPPRQSVLTPTRIVLSPPKELIRTPRDRSRSPQVMDLLNMSPPRYSIHPLPTIEEARLSASQPALRNSYVQVRMSPPRQILASDPRLSAPRSMTNLSPPRYASNAIEEARRARGEIGFGPIHVPPPRDIGPVSSYRQETFTGYPEFSRPASTQAEYRPQYSYENRVYSPPNRVSITPQVRLPMPDPVYIPIPPPLNFVPKYSPAMTTPPLVVSHTFYHPKETTTIEETSVAHSYPQKYLLQGPNVNLNVQAKESSSMVRESYSANELKLTRQSVTSQNPAHKGANELLERSRKLRETLIKGGNMSTSANQEQENKHRHTRVTSGYLDNDGNRIDDVQAYETQSQHRSGRKFSPERLRYQKIERTVSGLDDQRRVQNVSDFRQQSSYSRQNISESDANAFIPKYSDVNNKPLPRGVLNLDAVHATGVTSLPSGLYEGSPVKERIVNRSDAVELKPTETLKIVERKVRLSPTRIKNKASPRSRKYEDEFEQEDNDPKTSLANTLKKDLKAFKDSLNKGNYSSPSDARYNYRQNSNREEFNETNYNNVRTIKASEGRSQSPVQNRNFEGKTRPIIPKAEGFTYQEASNFADRENATSTSTSHGAAIGVGKTKKINLNMSKAGYSNERINDQEEINVRQLSGAPGLKLMVGDSYFYQTPNQKVGYKESTPVAAFTLEENNKHNTANRDDKSKVGRLVPANHGLFDQFKNIIYGYSFYRDIDAFKAACLLPRATLFDSPYLQLSVITKNENQPTVNDDFLKLIIHYNNKSGSDINDFSITPSDRCVQCSPVVQGAALSPKYQLKQEFYVNFFDFKSTPLVIDISYKQDGVMKRMNVALPITLNKFMKFKSGIDKNRFKQGWKLFKENSVTAGYRTLNAKFIRNNTEIMKYFDNNLLDITPQVSSKQKKKYGGVFDLPDGSEYHIKLSLDNSRMKISVNSGSTETPYDELIMQYLTFLLTV